MTTVLVVAAVVLVVTLSMLVRARGMLGALQRSFSASRRELESLQDQLRTVSTQRELLLEILNGLGEGLLAVDRNRRAVLANPRFAEMFAAPGDLVGRPLAEVARAAAVFSAFDEALAGRESQSRFPLRIGIAERAIEMRAFPLLADDIAAVALFLDVTQIERLARLRRNFISDFSHEVRTPMAGLRSAVESFELGAGQISPEEDQHLRRIMSRQLGRLGRLVDDLSELSRIESGDLPLDRRTVGLLELVRDVCDDFRELAAQKSLTIVLSGEAVEVCADPMRLQQALSNLVDNAIKYGGSNTQIEIHVGAEPGNALIEIRDHGEGIALEERDRIFQRFYRIDKGRSQEIGGSGLGLAITKHLVLIHRGSIDVQSVPGQGSTFIVRLPLG